MQCTIICDCPVARHEHGTRIMYVIHKCRGAECREAARAYEEKRRRQRLYGIQADRVDAQPVRDHVEFLRVNGVSYKALSKAAGVAHSAITAMLHGRAERGHAPYARVHRTTAEKILAVKPTMDNMAAGRNIDSTGTHRRIQALVTLGYSITNLGSRLNISGSNMWAMLNQDHVVVSTARKVRALYSQLWDVPNTATEWQHLAAATRAKNYAKLHGWLPPMAWDDDLIDDPNHAPVLEVENGAKRDANRAAFLEEVEHFIGCGETIDGIARALDLKPDSVEKRLTRYGRLDLLRQIGWAA